MAGDVLLHWGQGAGSPAVVGRHYLESQTLPAPASVTGLLVDRETCLARFFLMLQDPCDIKPGQILLGRCFCQKSKRAVYKKSGLGLFILVGEGNGLCLGRAGQTAGRIIRFGFWQRTGKRVGLGKAVGAGRGPQCPGQVTPWVPALPARLWHRSQGGRGVRAAPLPRGHE